MALTRYIMSDSIPSLSAEQPPGTPPFAASFFFGFFFFFFLLPSLFYLRFFFSLKRQKYPALSRTCDLPACLLARGMQNFCLSKKGWKERVDVEREKIERKGDGKESSFPRTEQKSFTVPTPSLFSFERSAEKETIA